MLKMNKCSALLEKHKITKNVTDGKYLIITFLTKENDNPLIFDKNIKGLCKLEYNDFFIDFLCIINNTSNLLTFFIYKILFVIKNIFMGLNLINDFLCFVLCEYFIINNSINIISNNIYLNGYMRKNFTFLDYDELINFI